MQLFGHAGETHETAAEAAEHAASSSVNGLLSLFLFIVLCAGLLWLLRNVIKWQPARIGLTFMAIFLFSGLFLYSYAPLVSIAALSGGLGLALLFSLASLAD